MVQLTLQAVATPNKSLIGTNCIYCSAADLAELGVKEGGFIQVKSTVFMVNSDPGAPSHCRTRSIHNLLSCVLAPLACAVCRALPSTLFSLLALHAPVCACV